MEDDSAVYDFVYCDDVGAVSFLIARGGYISMQPPQPVSSDEACVDEPVNTNLAQKIILGFGFTALSFVALLTVVNSESQMAGSLAFIKVNTIAFNIQFNSTTNCSTARIPWKASKPQLLSLLITHLHISFKGALTHHLSLSSSPRSSP
jgi:hypothetical protein